MNAQAGHNTAYQPLASSQLEQMMLTALHSTPYFMCSEGSVVRQAKIRAILAALPTASLLSVHPRICAVSSTVSQAFSMCTLTQQGFSVPMILLCSSLPPGFPPRKDLLVDPKSQIVYSDDPDWPRPEGTLGSRGEMVVGALAG